MKKSLNPKTFPVWMSGGELPDTKSVRGMFKKSEVQALRDNPRLRSPFGFCKAKRTV